MGESTGTYADPDTVTLDLGVQLGIEVFEEFVHEGRRYLAETERALAALPPPRAEVALGPPEAELLDEIFRNLHTIKGVSSFLGVAPIADLAHATESAVAALRAHRVTWSEELRGAVSGALEVLGLLLAALSGALTESARSPGQAAPRSFPVPRGLSGVLEELARLGFETELSPAARGAGPRASGRPDVPERGPRAGELRVAREKLEQLQALAGRLRASLDGWAVELEATEPSRSARERLASVRELAERLETAGSELAWIPAQVLIERADVAIERLAVELGREVELVATGSQVELDQGLAESMFAVLVHLLRNAVDHGVEAPAVRAALGKPRRGRVMLAFSVETRPGSSDAAGAPRRWISIEVADDGPGIDVRGLHERSRTLGLASGGGASREGGLELAFAPGLSTREGASLASGRGFGLDAARRMVEAAGGELSLDSVPGRGARFSIRVPAERSARAPRAISSREPSRGS